jgi:hypothetical protein
LPVSLAISTDLFESAAKTLNASFVAETLFLNNPLIAFIDGFAPGLFDPDEWLERIKSVSLPESLPDVPDLSNLFGSAD